jgi:hypothetical protein
MRFFPHFSKHFLKQHQNKTNNPLQWNNNNLLAIQNNDQLQKTVKSASLKEYSDISNELLYFEFLYNNICFHLKK